MLPIKNYSFDAAACHLFYTYSSFSVQYLFNYKSSAQIICKSFFQKTMYMVSNKMFFFSCLSPLSTSSKNIFIVYSIDEYHSHTKRNSLNTQAAFIECLEYVNNSRVVIYWGDRPFLRSSRLAMAFDGIEGILAFLDNNMLIAIVTAKQFRD